MKFKVFAPVTEWKRKYIAHKKLTWEQCISRTWWHKYPRLWRVWNFSLTVVWLNAMSRRQHENNEKIICASIIWNSKIILWAVGMDGVFRGCLERPDRILKNMDHTDVKIKCSKIRAQLCQGSSAMPTFSEPFQACLSVRRRAAPFPVYACAEVHIRELASSRRFFHTPQEIFSLKWLIIYHLSKPLEFR